jgi:hypothetical protein
MTRFLPIAGWLPRYDRSWLRGDVLAGVAVTALIVPKNLGYAGIAGVPLENGPQVREVLEKDGLVDEIGADHIHGNVHRAVEAQLAATPSL